MRRTYRFCTNCAPLALQSRLMILEPATRRSPICIEFPFKKLKIDRSFIAGIVDREELRAIVHAAVSLGHALDITVTAEGVETPEQLTALRTVGCDEAQGYFFGRPVGADEAHTLIEKQWQDLNAGPSLAGRRQVPSAGKCLIVCCGDDALFLPLIGRIP